MRGSSHIRSVLIGIEYLIQSKPIYKFVTYISSSPLVTSPLSNLDGICPIQIAKRKKTSKVLQQFLYLMPIKTL